MGDKKKSGKHFTALFAGDAAAGPGQINMAGCAPDNCKGPCEAACQALAENLDCKEVCKYTPGRMCGTCLEQCTGPACKEMCQRECIVDSCKLLCKAQNKA
jgi:hypothetical protein